ncbi:MAG: hypothetical protein AAF404_16420 [Pseudomonadota bacterium]
MYNIYVRVRSTGGNSFYTIFDGLSETHIDDVIVSGSYTWLKVRQVSMINDRVQRLYIGGRQAGVMIDKVIMQPSSETDPTGAGTAVSTVSQVIDDDTKSIKMRMVMIGQSLTLKKNIGSGSRIRFSTEPVLHQSISGYAVTGSRQQQVRRLSFPLRLAQSDRFSMWQLEAKLSGKAFMINCYPSKQGWFSGNYQFLARFTTALEFTHQYDDLHLTDIDAIEA